MDCRISYDKAIVTLHARPHSFDTHATDIRPQQLMRLGEEADWVAEVEVEGEQGCTCRLIR